MSDLNLKIDALSKTGEWLLQNDSPELEFAALKSQTENPWFTLENIRLSTKSIAEQFLKKRKLEEWLNNYSINQDLSVKSIGLIMAGNLPLVGFHDFLTVYLSGYKAQIKLSSKDQFLLPCIVEKIAAYDPGIKEQIIFVEKIKAPDAAIATGSGNSARYFEYYFRDIPHIIRKNRNSVAVLSGNETDEELLGLGDDVFQYFGLGCRSVSALFVPQNYSFKRMMELFREHWSMLNNHVKYRNNYEYNLACALMESKKLIVGDDLLLFEESSFISRIACLHYSQYQSIDEVKSILNGNDEDIQCVVSNVLSHNEVQPQLVCFGQAQQPGLMDYADGVDTMEFLLSMK